MFCPMSEITQMFHCFFPSYDEIEGSFAALWLSATILEKSDALKPKV